jgi:hypothetical protein
MRRIVIAKMFSLTLLGLYLAVGFTLPTGEGSIDSPVRRCAEEPGLRKPETDLSPASGVLQRVADNAIALGSRRKVKPA